MMDWVMNVTFHSFALGLVALCSIASPASAADARLQTGVGEVRERISEREPKIGQVEVKFKDGTRIKGRYVGAEQDGLRLLPRVKVGEGPLKPCHADV